MIFAALNEAAQAGELILVQDGLCRWHLRRDGVVTIREIVVLPSRRRMGVGRRMVEEVIRANPGCRVACRCPVVYESNAFWHGVGFTLVTTADGMNLWEFQSSSTALMAHPS